ncbi:hypothetical protein GCM10011611_61150 [Aliidongia dinghuensis]|uniref:Uncharacterized protein n=2 Tax=Aliidongia dinghuensis TaxID=1867774 RepID=A0A8J2Z0F7_9PROT|nr:hypothetical protein GCM10011611_61150 [Aliidongia dinghuensis]
MSWLNVPENLEKLSSDYLKYPLEFSVFSGTVEASSDKTSVSSYSTPTTTRVNGQWITTSETHVTSSTDREIYVRSGDMEKRYVASGAGFPVRPGQTVKLCMVSEVGAEKGYWCGALNTNMDAFTSEANSYGKKFARVSSWHLQVIIAMMFIVGFGVYGLSSADHVIAGADWMSVQVGFWGGIILGTPLSLLVQRMRKDFAQDRCAKILAAHIRSVLSTAA